VFTKMNIFRSRQLSGLALILVIAGSAHRLSASDWKITLPKRTKATPVQRLNQEGVDAVCKHQYDKANALFYKAYLYDPDDPFTLNNLAYIAEMDGQVDRAEQLYALAARQTTDAVIDRSSLPELKGESFRDEVAGIHNQDMQISRVNVAAVHLLSRGRGSEAKALLQVALARDPRNAFTLNNLGVAEETEGDLESALKYYTAATGAHSSRVVVVAFNRAWRGKPISDVAERNAERVSQRIQTETPEEHAALLSLQGVTAVNRNDWNDAVKYFRGAYSLDPNNAFTLNNLGFVEEMSGDRETAQFLYDKAHQAAGAGARVGLATRQSAEGLSLSQVSDDNDHKDTSILQQEAETRRKQSGPVQLKHRDNTPVIEPEQPPAAPPSAPGASAPGNSPPQP